MSMTVTRTEGVTVLTMTSNQNSNCPLLCQILGSLCYSPVCSVSQRLKGLLGGTGSALGTAQIMIGLLNIGVGAIMNASRSWWTYSPLIDSLAFYWLGSLFVVCGVICLLAEKFPSAVLVVMTGLMNFASAALAVTAAVLYSIDITTTMKDYSGCDGYNDYYYDQRPTTPPVPSHNVDICKQYQAYSKFLWRGLDIVMIIFSVLQFAIAISAGVLAFKAVCKKDTSVHDPELNKPLVNEDLSCPAV